jgi:RNA-binding protein
MSFRAIGFNTRSPDCRVSLECRDLQMPVILTMRPMELSERQRKYLRGLGHALNPVLLIGSAGLTPGVIAEAKRALHDHELIKVKFRGAEREARDAGLAELATSTESELIQRIGHTALYYKRRNDRPGIVIPDA